MSRLFFEIAGRAECIPYAGTIKIYLLRVAHSLTSDLLNEPSIDRCFIHQCWVRVRYATTKSLKELSLYAGLRSIAGTLTPYGAEKLTFPKVDFDQSTNPGIMTGLETTDQRGDTWRVKEAVQQTRIKMNRKGGLAESAAAVGFFCTSVRLPPPEIVIDGPMWLWISKPGMRLPLFTAQFGYDTLKDPGDIEFGKKVVA